MFFVSDSCASVTIDTDERCNSCSVSTVTTGMWQHLIPLVAMRRLDISLAKAERSQLYLRIRDTAVDNTYRTQLLCEFVPLHAQDRS